MAARGSASLAPRFQMPVVMTAVVMSTPEKPKEENILYVMAIATAPPAGTVFEMAAVVSVWRNPSKNPKPGSAAW